MTINPEKQETPIGEQKQEVEEIKETIEIPLDLEKAGVTPVVSQITQVQVTDDTKSFSKTDDNTNTKTITLPATIKQLHENAKGSIANAITWLARFWLRLIEKSAINKWKIIGKVGDEVGIEKEINKQGKLVTGNG